MTGRDFDGRLREALVDLERSVPAAGAPNRRHAVAARSPRWTVLAATLAAGIVLGAGLTTALTAVRETQPGDRVPAASSQSTATPTSSQSLATPASCAEGGPWRSPDPSTVLVYFTCPETRTPPDVFGVTREAGTRDTRQRLTTALQELLAGPSAEEAAAGLTSLFSSATAGALRSASIDADGAVVIDFSDLSTVIPNASTSNGRRMLLAELNATTWQFVEVESVEYRLEGSCDRFWTWLQAGGCQVLRPGTPLETPMPTASGLPSVPPDAEAQWELIELPEIGPLAQVADTHATDSTVLVVGSVASMVDEFTVPAAWYSLDGRQWHAATVEDSLARAYGLGPIVEADGELISIGSAADASTPALFTSADEGRTWHRRGDANWQKSGQIYVYAVTRGGPGFVAVGAAPTGRTPNETAAMVWTSRDGLDWSPIPSAGDHGPGALFTGYLTDVATDGSVLMATGFDWDKPGEPGLWRSTDGLTWTSVGEESGLLSTGGIEYTSRGWYIATNDPSATDQGAPLPAIYSSEDGLSWERAEMEGPSARAALDLAAGERGLVAVGDRTDGAVAWTSTDGEVWIGHELAGHSDRDSAWHVVAFNGTFVIAGLTEAGDDRRLAVVWVSTSSTASPEANVGACDYVTPRTLPSGADPGDPRSGTVADQPGIRWGREGSDQVAQVIGSADAVLPSDLPADSPYLTEVRGEPAAITFVGDPGVGEVTISWVAEDCIYTIWLPAGFTLGEAADYAREF